MPGTTEVPSLDEFIDSGRVRAGACKFVRLTTPEQREAIALKHAEGVRAWTAFARWLDAQGVSMAPYCVEYHFTRGHDVDA